MVSTTARRTHDLAARRAHRTASATTTETRSPLAHPAVVGEECLEARALEYVMASGVCATCLVGDGDADGAPAGDPPAAELPTCPTCGRASVEYALAREIDERVTALAGLAALDAALG